MNSGITFESLISIALDNHAVFNKIIYRTDISRIIAKLCIQF
jgi:hypothetical protein